MRALTISQPYASLIASGEKWVENRTWPTNYRGPIAIHAGSGTQYLTRRELQAYPHGCVIAIAKLTACVPLRSLQCRAPLTLVGESSRLAQNVLEHKYTEGPFCWILQDVLPIEPVACPGARQLWEWVGIAKVLEQAK